MTLSLMQTKLKIIILFPAQIIGSIKVRHEPIGSTTQPCTRLQSHALPRDRNQLYASRSPETTILKTSHARSSRPRVMTHHQDRRIRLRHLRSRFQIFVVTAREIEDTHTRPINAVTVRPRLCHSGLRCMQPLIRA